MERRKAENQYLRPNSPLERIADREVQHHNLAVWNAFLQKKHTPLTTISLPSLSFPQSILKDIKAIELYENRSLWEILRGGRQSERVIFLCSQNLHMDQLHLIRSLASSKLKSFIISLNDARTDLTLTQKLLSKEVYIDLIKQHFMSKNIMLQPFNVTCDEIELGKKLGAPVFGMHPNLENLASKSGNRALFKLAKVSYARGVENIDSADKLYAAIIELWGRLEEKCSLLLKTNHGVSGQGIAKINLPCSFKDFLKNSFEEQRLHIQRMIQEIEGLNEILLQGAVLEEFIEGENKSSPSAQGIIYPDGSTRILSTHEQVFDRENLTYLGAQFPACSDYRQELIRETSKIARQLAVRGVIGYFSVDFLAVEKTNQLYAIEINLRRGGTTHPYYTALFSGAGQYDSARGIMVNHQNENISYICDDNIQSDKMIGLDSRHLFQFLKSSDLIFNREKGYGVIPHMLEALNDYGKFGATIVHNNASKAQELHRLLLNKVKEFRDF